jgi:hypothetical protein
MSLIKKHDLRSAMAKGFVILLVLGMGCSTSSDSTVMVISDMNEYIGGLQPENSYEEMKLKLAGEELERKAWEAHVQRETRQTAILERVKENLRRANEGSPPSGGGAGGTDVPPGIPTGGD